MTEWVITSSILILLIVLLRLFLRKKIAARVQYALWLVVLVRLLLPVTLMDSRVSILNLVPEYGAIHTAEDTDAGTAAGTEEEIGTEKTGTEDNIQAYDTDSADQNLQAKVQQADGKDTAHYKKQVSEVMNTEISDSEMETFDGEGSRMKNSMEQRAAVRRWVLCSEAAGRNEDKDVFVLAESGLIDKFRYILRDFDQSRMENILGIIWIAGMVICAGSILLSNMVFYRRVRRSSRKLDTEWPEELHGSLFNRRNRGISVYQSGFLNTPCMLGILCPAIYVTEEAMQDKGTLYYVISHEKTHFVHGDHIWALLRTICLCIHWYNPLVWMAARLSKQDAEFACDEGTLAYLGEKERIPYGRALLAMSAGQDFRKHMGITNLATTMWGGKKQLKERLQFIAKKPEIAVGAVILAVLASAAAVGLTFTGRKSVSVQDGQTQENFSQNEAVRGNLLQKDTADGSEGEQNTAGQKPAEADTENQSRIPAEEQLRESANDSAQVFGYMGYTGYLDECEQWTYYTEFMDCDFDGDGKNDRIYREEKGGEICDYRIEFGNGDTLLVDDISASGWPHVQAGDITGNGSAEILFSLSYDFSTDPMAFGDAALYEKGPQGYELMKLPLGYLEGEGAMPGDNPKYEPYLTIGYDKTAGHTFQLMAHEIPFQADVPIEEEQWENAEIFDGEVSENPVHAVEMVQGDDGPYLECHIGVFDKWIADEIIVKVVYEDGALQVSQAVYVLNYVERVSVNTGAGKEYQLQLYGKANLGEGLYHITSIDVLQIHDNVGEWIQSIYPDTAGELYRGTDELPMPFASRDGGIIVEDLNFDGKEDFRLRGIAQGDDIPYYCYLWDEQLQKFVYGFTLPNVETDREKEQIIYTVGDSDTESVTRYCSYDESGRLSLVREVREDKSQDAVLTSVDLFYVEEPYSIPAFEIYDGSYDNVDVGYWAEEALKELYQWTGMEGLKESKYYFTVTEYGDYYFAKTEEDISASRYFYSRCYGKEAGFEHCIPSMSIVYADYVWYSDIKQTGWPDGYRNMSDEELCSWYLENAAIAQEEKVKSITETFEGNFVAEMESGHFYEMTYSSGKRLISSVYGPYDGFPQH